MSSKVLVADDSLTIQKVVSITLSGDEFTLIECLNENDLIAKVSSQEFDLILIDFNLSDSRTGYQLCKEVSSISQNTPILAMLGTFDSVQEDELSDAGVSDKIVKPFESEKFIKKCRDLVGQDHSDAEDEEFQEFEDSYENDVESSDDTDNDENWVVDTPGLEFDLEDKSQEQDEQKQEQEDVSAPLSSAHPLESELENWGISVPGVIGQGENEKGLEKPPVIQSIEIESSSEQLEADDTDEDPIEPAQADLEYPDLEGMHQREASEVRSRLVPFDDLDSTQEEDFSDNDEDETDPAIQIEGLNDLEKEIEDEISPDEFWATDSDEETLESEGVDDHGSISGALENPVIKEEVEASNMPSQDVSVEQIDIDELAEKIKERLTPMLDEWAKKYCENAVDKVAWEVIPDLAENLIRKEIQEISESVKD